MDGDSFHTRHLDNNLPRQLRFALPPAMPSPFKINRTGYVIDRRYLNEGGAVPGIGSRIANSIRFWLGTGRGRRLIEEKWKEHSFKIGSLTGGDDDKVITLNESPDGRARSDTTHEPAFKVDESTVANADERKKGRRRWLVLPYNKTFEGPKVTEVDGKLTETRGEIFNFPDRTPSPPEKAPCEWHDDPNQTRRVVDGATPFWPPKRVKDDEVSVTLGTIYEALLDGIKLPSVETRRIPDGLPRRPAGFTKDTVGIMHTKRTIYEAAKRRSALGINRGLVYRRDGKGECRAGCPRENYCKRRGRNP